MSKLKVQSLKCTYTRAKKHAIKNRAIKLTRYELTQDDSTLESIMRDDRKIALLNYVLSVNTNISGKKI